MVETAISNKKKTNSTSNYCAMDKSKRDIKEHFHSYVNRHSKNVGNETRLNWANIKEKYCFNRRERRRREHMRQHIKDK